MSHRVLVTGGAGFIGRQAVSALSARGFDVVSVGRADGDLLDPVTAQRLVERTRPSHLLHLAWETTPGAYWTHSDNPHWLAASERLLDAFYDQGGLRAVTGGTCAEYDWARASVCVEGTTPTVGPDATPYARCKLALSEIAAARDAAHGRIFLPYGPHEAPVRLVPSVIRALLDGERARCSPGTQVRNFMHVADVGGVLAALVDSEVQGPVNIGSSERHSVAEVVSTIGRLLDRPDLIELGALPARPDEPALLVPDVSRLEEVGWSPGWDLETGLQQTIGWWKAR